jgi:hypothetical protein
MYGLPSILVFIVSVSCVLGQNGDFGIILGKTNFQDFEESHPWEPKYEPSMDYTSHLSNNNYNQRVQQGFLPQQPGSLEHNHFGPGFPDQRQQHPQMQQHTQQITIIAPPAHVQAFYNSHNGGFGLSGSRYGGFGFGGSGFDAPGIRFGAHHSPFYGQHISPMFVPYEKPTFMDKVGQFAKSDAGKAIGASKYCRALIRMMQRVVKSLLRRL